MSQFDIHERLRVQKIDILSDNWYVLRNANLEFRRRDCFWVTHTREAYDQGNGSTILLYNKALRTIILTPQFRFPAIFIGYHGFLMESCTGVVDQDVAENCSRRGTEEETGFRVRNVCKVFEEFMSPGSITEILYFFVSEYDDRDRTGNGEGLESDGEDIEVLGIRMDDAIQPIASCEIMDVSQLCLCSTPS
jgi:nudix-type nucleoside diphosphatase (YffH/AdpP family)